MVSTLPAHCNFDDHTHHLVDPGYGQGRHNRRRIHNVPAKPGCHHDRRSQEVSRR